MSAAFGKGRVSLAKRLMVLIVFASTALATLATAGQLYAEYWRDVDRLHAVFGQVEQSYLGSVEANAWLADRDRLQTLMDGIVQLPDFVFAEVAGEDGVALASAGRMPEDGVVEVYPLSHEHRGEMLDIGAFTISADYQAIYSRLYERAVGIILSNFLKTAVVSLVIIWLIHHMVTRHLDRVAGLALADTPHSLEKPFILDRKPSRHHYDELDDLVTALNKMRSDLSDSFIRVRTSEGRYRDLFDLSPVAIAEEDISGVQQRFEALRKRQRVSDLEAWLDGNPNEVDDLIRRTVIVRVNEQMENLLGENAAELCANLHRPWVTPEFKAFFKRLFVHLWNGDTHALDEAQVLDSHGEVRDIMIGWCTTTSPGRRTHGRLIISLIDITERKSLETSLKRGVEELTRSNTELERFAYIASHDLREPIRSIVSYSQIISRRYGKCLDKDGAEFLHHVVSAGERMYAMIQDLLDYSRLGPATTDYETVDLNDCLKSALECLSGGLEETRAIVTADHLPVVRGNSVQLTTMFQHLMSNALKYRRPDTVPSITIEAETRGDMWHLRFIDNGIGIDMQSAEKVFEIFRRLHTADAYPGSGIGLAICRRIVQTHGGRIWLTSEADKGTTFHIMLPCGDHVDGEPTQHGAVLTQGA